MIDLANMIAMMLADGPVSPWFAPIKITLLVVIVLLSLFMVLIVLLQPGNSSGLGAISGGAETFFGKNKAKTLEGKLKKLTIIVAVALVVLCIVYAVITVLGF
jgi:preprotein translocase, secG subunit